MSSEEAATSSFRRPKRPTAIRQRKNSASPEPSSASKEKAGEHSSEEEDEMEDPVESYVSVVQKRRLHRRRHLIQTTSKKRKNQLDALGDNSDSEEGDGARPSPLEVQYSSSGTAESLGPKDMGATARSEIDTEIGQDAQSQFERVQKALKEQPGTSDKKIYRGMAMYGAREKEDTVKGNASSGLNRRGPIRASQYMRAIVRWDYAPDICKDYKETGFCTFGDSCKFLHDRSDYKHGWEIDRELEAGRLKEEKEDEYLISGESGDEGEEDGGGDDKLPFACLICRESFKNPVITKCGHHFCEACALNHYKRNKKCAVCGVSTEGVFKVAKDILAKIAAVKASKDADAEGEEGDGPTVEAQTLPLADEDEDGSQS